MGDRGKAETLKAETLKSEIGNRGRGRGHIFWFRLTLWLGFETRSLPTLAHSCPRRFTFYVARPTRSIHQNRVVGFPRLTRQELATSRRKVRACEPLSASIMYPPYNLLTFPMLVPGFLGALAWLGASRRKVGSQPTLHSGVILHRGLPGALLCAAL
jgi:hypothetical protein